MRVQPRKPRWSAEPGAGGGRGVAPAARSWLAVLFLPCWLAFWYTGAVSAVREIAAKGPWQDGGFLIFWLCFWARTYRFGHGLDEAEAKGVVLYLQQLAPSLAPKSPESAAAGAQGEG